MLKYLARTSSEGELNKVLHQNARFEGTLAERRKRAGKLRNEQEDLEKQLHNRVHLLASSLQADANAKAAARAQAAVATRREHKAAEQAARVMGAVAPHRASAREAALAVVAPREWQPTLSPPKSASPKRPGSPGSPSAANGNKSLYLPVRPGRYCLRSCIMDLDSLEQDTFVVAAEGAITLGSADEAATAPWTVRQPAGSHACTLTSGINGAKLYASATGQLAVGEPPKPELSYFLIVPNAAEEERAEEAALGAGAGSSGPGALPNRPFSSHSPRVSSIQPPKPAQRPQTALASSGGGGGSALLSSATSPVGGPLLVRLYHSPSRRYLHIDRSTGVASLQHSMDGSSLGGSARQVRSPFGRPSAAVPQPSITFELLLRHSPPGGQRPQSSGGAAGGQPMPPMRALPTPGPQPVLGGTSRLRVGTAPASMAGGHGSGSRPTAQPSLPVRAFDMATGSVRSQHEPGLLGGWRPSIGGVGLGLATPWLAPMFDGAPPVFALGDADTQAGPQQPGGGSSGGSSGAVGGGSGATVVASGRRHFGGAEDRVMRQSAWEASQLDLSDMMAQGPLKLSSLFSCGVGGPSFAGAPAVGEPSSLSKPPPAELSSAQYSVSHHACQHHATQHLGTGPAGMPPLGGPGALPPFDGHQSGHQSRKPLSARRRGPPTTGHRFQTRVPNPGIRGLP